VRTVPIQSMQREERDELSAAHKVANLVVVAVPFAAFIAALALLWNKWVGWQDVAILFVMYCLTLVGITIGYHRMLTHRSFETYGPIRWLFTVLGTMGVEGPAITWVADHRKHHAFADEDGDPHSPHGHGGGFVGAAKGLAHAHVGWIFRFEGRAEPRRYAPDLVKDRAMRVISALFVPIVGVSLAMPALLGFLLTGFELKGALTGFLWGGLVRIFLLHHVTWSINSVCHFVGRRRFDTDDESRNVFWLALPSFGEAWHHNHHAFPTSASHGLRWWEVDPAGLIIRAMEKVGLAWNVVKVSPEKQAAKALAS
jgi:stearoyl-CoA desaturase (delta-9 desaturase)